MHYVDDGMTRKLDAIDPVGGTGTEGATRDKGISSSSSSSSPKTITGGAPQALEQLVKKWRRASALKGPPNPYWAGFDNALCKCADELEAALAGPAPQPPADKVMVKRTHLEDLETIITDLRTALAQTLRERDEAREQFDRHVEWASGQVAASPQPPEERK